MDMDFRCPKCYTYLRHNNAAYCKGSVKVVFISIVELMKCIVTEMRRGLEPSC